MKGMFMCNLHSATTMDNPMIKLNGINEGVSILIETHLEGADDPNKVADAVHALFPAFPLPKDANHPSFQRASNAVWTAQDLPIDHFLAMLHTQRILDTALDAMGRNHEGKSTQFSLSRQAALAAKVAFPLPGEVPLGGVITVKLSSPNLLDWLHAATWHKGRDHVPRTINDERAMAKDGEANTWV
ncbi:hypothetical protein N9J16_00235 [Candidatus Poseidoniaceae archaeon]|jgi:predicted RNA binding protein with dsRBD fold (UPF0201 family)|nr:hypothetical protein [Candidatus Poseidoniaceae archaeon]|tara:strand:- start:150 stop:707 length:558 start_codon:yes stop_codon:yes gene_type:complete